MGSKKKVNNRRLTTKAAINNDRRKNKADTKEMSEDQQGEVRDIAVLTPSSWTPNGLQNLGNTCFFNATLQALSSCVNENYPLYLLPDDSGFLNKIFLSTLTQNNHSVLKESSSNISNSMNPSKLLAVISKISTQFKGRRQQDAHEVCYINLKIVYLCIFIDMMDKDSYLIFTQIFLQLYVSMIAALDDEKITFLKDNKENEHKILPSMLFTGSHASILTCGECSSRTCRVETSFDTSCEIPGSEHLSVVKAYRKPYIKPRKGAFTFAEDEDEITIIQNESVIQINSTDNNDVKETDDEESKYLIEVDILNINSSLSKLSILSNLNDNSAEIDISVENNYDTMKTGESELRREDKNSSNSDLVSDICKISDENGNELFNHSNQSDKFDLNISEVQLPIIEGEIEKNASAAELSPVIFTTESTTQDTSRTSATPEATVHYQAMTLESTMDTAILTSEEGVEEATAEKIASSMEVIGSEVITTKTETETIENPIAEISERKVITPTVEAAAENREAIEIEVEKVVELELLVPSCNPTMNSSNPVPSIQDCLTAFTREEILSAADGNGFYCAKCSPLKSLVNAKKRILLLDCPMMLSIHLKRLLSGGKYNGHVKFPLELNIKDYTAIRKDLRGKKEDVDIKLEATKNIIPDSSDVNDSISDEKTIDIDRKTENIDNQIESEFKDVIYDLCSVIVHQGGSLGGHYVAYVRNKEGNWYYCSDTTVKSCTEADVLRAQAYMLYYQSRDTKFDRLLGIDNDHISGENVENSDTVNKNNEIIMNVSDEIILNDNGNILNENENNSNNDDGIIFDESNKNVSIGTKKCNMDICLDLNEYSSTKERASKLKKAKETTGDESNSRVRLSRKCKVGL